MTFKTEELHQSLFGAILAHPADDLARLAYADFLADRHGPGDAARAEFIQLQVIAADARLPKAEKERLAQRASGLLVQHRQAWEQPLLDLACREIAWERGFPSKVRMAPDAFLSHAGKLLCLAPISHLDLRLSFISDERAAALAQSRYLSNLTHLNLGGNYIGINGAAALARSPHLANLAHLDLRDNHIGNEGARALAQSPHLANLTHLDLRLCFISDEGVRALAESPYFKPEMRILTAVFNGTFAEFRRRVQTRTLGNQAGGEDLPSH